MPYLILWILPPALLLILFHFLSSHCSTLVYANTTSKQNNKTVLKPGGLDFNSDSITNFCMILNISLYLNFLICERGLVLTMRIKHVNKRKALGTVPGSL